LCDICRSIPDYIIVYGGDDVYVNPRIYCLLV
jgi:hypothetical protein